MDRCRVWPPVNDVDTTEDIVVPLGSRVLWEMDAVPFTVTGNGTVTSWQYAAELEGSALVNPLWASDPLNPGGGVILGHNMEAETKQGDILNPRLAFQVQHRVLRPVTEDLPNAALGQFRFKLFRSSRGDQFPAIKQAEPVAVFRLVQVMGRDENRDPLFRKFVDEVPEPPAVDGVHP